MTDPAQPLRDFSPQHDYFIGIDSDGCVFDTMELKQKECFAPNTIKHWRLQPVSKFARQTIEFVNLYSQWRGINRWPALVMVFDLLRERPEVARRGVSVPAADVLRAFIAQKEYPHSDSGLKAYIASQPPSEELQTALRWTEAVNTTVAEMVRGVSPFPFVRESLELLRDKADLMVVSATPTAALEQEWREHGIAEHVRLIAGQELGTKAEHLRLAAADRYAPDHILMVGDAPGDMKAAKANHALFYPINPGEEDKSWERFYNEALQRFFAGTYAGDYEAGLIAEFNGYLPDTPPWKHAKE